MSSEATVADRYARAVFDLGIESGELGELVGKIDAFASAYRGAKELRVVLENPQVVASEREAILRAIASRLGLGKLELNVVRYLAHRRRLRLLPDVANKLARLSDERNGVVRATVSVAGPLPEAFYERLTRELETITGRRVVLEREEDPALIAGVVTRIGDNTIDGSIRGRLDQLERQLLD